MDHDLDQPARHFLSGTMQEAGHHAWSVCRERLQAAARAQRSPRKCWLAVGTDCSGGNAPVFAWKSLARCAAQDDILIEISHELSSEDTRAKHCQRFIQMNHAPNRFYNNLLARPDQGGPVFSCSPECTPDADGNVSLPQCGSLDIYDAGFECQDNSSRNQHGKELDLRWAALDDPSSGVSTLTLLASCRRIRALQPRVFRLENVRNCDMSRVLIFLVTLPRIRD